MQPAQAFVLCSTKEVRIRFTIEIAVVFFGLLIIQLNLPLLFPFQSANVSGLLWGHSPLLALRWSLGGPVPHVPNIVLLAGLTVFRPQTNISSRVLGVLFGKGRFFELHEHVKRARPHLPSASAPALPTQGKHSEKHAPCFL